MNWFELVHLKHLLNGRGEEAQAQLSWVSQHGPRYFIEHEIAETELRRLEMETQQAAR